MPQIERYVLLGYDDRNYEFHVLAASDDQAIITAIRKLESRLGMMRGGLKKYFKENPESIIVKFREG